MANFIPEEVVEQVRSSLDLVKVISGYMELKRTGRNYVGLCPFHQEKTPSFMVSPDKQIFRCFGCGQGGNVFSFIMERENLTFPEAVKYLAKQAGIRVPEREMTPGQKKQAALKEELKQVMDLAAQFYHIILMKKKTGFKALEYLKERGVQEETAKSFNLGFAPTGWENLINFAGKRGVSPELLHQAGLAGSRPSGGYYDSFRSRIIFPICSLQGDVVGLGGRIFGEGEPKYYNSPQTPLYDKSKNLFGLDRARRGIRDQGYSVIMEGYMDVIIAHQNGIKNAVASLGTSVTAEQAKLLRVQAEEVVIAYDADAAGDAATLRGLEILKKAGCTVRVAELPRDMDPDDYIRERGGEAFSSEIIGEALPLVDYRLKKSREKYDITGDTQDKLAYSREAVGILAEIFDNLEREHYIKRLEEELSLPGDSLRREIRRQLRGSYHKITEKGKTTINVSLLQEQRSPADSAERALTALILHKPELTGELSEAGLKPEDFTNAAYKDILEKVLDLNSRGEKDLLAKIFDCFQDKNIQGLLSDMGMEEGTDENITKKVLSDCIKRIKLTKLNKERKNIEVMMQEMEKEKENERMNELLKEWERLLKLEDSILHPRERRE